MHLAGNANRAQSAEQHWGKALVLKLTEQKELYECDSWNRGVRTGEVKSLCSQEKEGESCL